jgi:hypothetical protein
MAYRELQTDFFAVPERYLDATYAFMSFNDVGNFLGRICRRFDLKLGERGLVYVYRRAHGNYVVDLEITTDFARVCAFLGLDHAAWLEGFAGLEAVFEWVIACPYFSATPYLDGGEDAIKARARTRTSVARFIEHVRARGIDKDYAWADRHTYLPQVIAAFPEAALAERIAAERVLEERELRVREKLDGKRVMRLVPGLEGKALGEVMLQLKRSTTDFEAWVLETSQDDIDARVRAIAAAATGGEDAPR